MADSEQLALLKQSVSEWNRWRARSKDFVDLDGANLVDTNLSNANLRDAQLSHANLAGAALSGAFLDYAFLQGAVLQRAVLRGTRLTHASLLSANLQGADLDRAVCTHANLSAADLTGATLRGADLAAAVFTGACLLDAILSAARLWHADLTEAKLTGASLVGADLAEAKLRYTNLSGADLTGANLMTALFAGAIFKDTNLDRATLNQTVFAGVDLHLARGLEGVCHLGPSSLGVDTLMRSGQLPAVFLRGAGLPDRFIDYAGSLVTTAIQYYSCFISYSTQDQEFADRLYADLQHKGVRCWFAPHDVRSGRKLHEQIDEAIRRHDKLLLILSPASISSPWVNTEISKARKREVREQHRMLFPLRLVDFETLKNWECFDADTGKDSAREIREYVIPDFSQWKTNHRAYTEAFDRLLKDLRADAAADV